MSNYYYEQGPDFDDGLGLSLGGIFKGIGKGIKGGAKKVVKAVAKSPTAKKALKGAAVAGAGVVLQKMVPQQSDASDLDAAYVNGSPVVAQSRDGVGAALHAGVGPNGLRVGGGANISPTLLVGGALVLLLVMRK